MSYIHNVGIKNKTVQISSLVCLRKIFHCNKHTLINCFPNLEFSLVLQFFKHAESKRNDDKISTNKKPKPKLYLEKKQSEINMLVTNKANADYKGLIIYKT